MDDSKITTRVSDVMEDEGAAGQGFLDDASYPIAKSKLAPYLAEKLVHQFGEWAASLCAGG